MSTASLTPAQLLVARFDALLRAQGVEIARAAPEEGLNAIQLPGEAECGLCPGMLLLTDLQTGEAVPTDTEALVLMQLIYQLPLRAIRSPDLSALYTLIGLINPTLSTGAFELDSDDNTVHIRWSLLVPAAPSPSDAFLLAPLYEVLNAIDLWYGAFSALVEQRTSPIVAYTEAFVRIHKAEGATIDAASAQRLIDRLHDRAAGQFAPRLLTDLRSITA